MHAVVTIFTPFPKPLFQEIWGGQFTTCPRGDCQEGKKKTSKDSKFLALVQMRDKNNFEKRYKLREQVFLPLDSKLGRREKSGKEKEHYKQLEAMHSVSHS